jgi:hypothetical protein
MSAEAQRISLELDAGRARDADEMLAIRVRSRLRVWRAPIAEVCKRAKVRVATIASSVS